MVVIIDIDIGMDCCADVMEGRVDVAAAMAAASVVAAFIMIADYVVELDSIVVLSCVLSSTQY